MPRKQYDPDAEAKEQIRGITIALARTLATIFNGYALDSVEKEATELADKFIAFLEAE